jgi:hypothetical protein
VKYKGKRSVSPPECNFLPLSWAYQRFFLYRSSENPRGTVVIFLITMKSEKLTSTYLLNFELVIEVIFRPLWLKVKNYTVDPLLTGPRLTDTRINRLCSSVYSARFNRPQLFTCAVKPTCFQNQITYVSSLIYLLY